MDQPSHPTLPMPFAEPDWTPEPRASDLYLHEHAQTVAAVEHVAIALIILLALVVVWLAVRALMGSAPGRLRRLLTLWLDAKECELRDRARRQP